MKMGITGRFPYWEKMRRMPHVNGQREDGRERGNVSVSQKQASV